MNAAHIGTAIFLDNLQGSSAHLLTTLVILDNIQHFAGELALVSDHFASLNLT